MKKVLSTLLIGIIAVGSGVFAQQAPVEQARLEEVYQWTVTNYPLIHDLTVINTLEKISLEVISKDGLPRISVNGTGQLQTENIAFPSGGGLLEAPLETWNSSLNIEYDLFDGGKRGARKNIEIASAEVERRSLEVQLRYLKPRVNNLIFAISLARKQEEILKNTESDLSARLSAVQSGFQNGTNLESDVFKLKVRLLELQSDLIETRSRLKSYTDLLEPLTGKDFSATCEFVLPRTAADLQTAAPDRPEQELFENQKELLEVQKGLVSANNLPKITVFAQGGVGNPNPVNFADFTTSAYALGGIKLSWNPFDFGKSKKEKQRLTLQQEQVENDLAVFLFDVESNLKEYRATMEELNQKITNDAMVIDLQKEILKQSQVQLDNGVIRASEYITQINTTLTAEQQLELNTVRLNQTIIDYLTEIGQL